MNAVAALLSCIADTVSRDPFKGLLFLNYFVFKNKGELQNGSLALVKNAV